MENAIKIYLIRHARQESPLCNVNVSLAKAGLLQSKLVAERLASYHIDKVYSSNLIRAKETAEIIIKHLNMVNNIDCKLALKTFEDLNEIDYGDMTGLDDQVLHTRFSNYFKERNRMIQDIPIPGGESGSQVFDRINECINGIVELAMTQNDRNIAIISHGGAIRSYLAGILGIPQQRRYLIAKTLENCSVSEVIYHIDTKQFTVERINDYAHLEHNTELLRSSFKKSL